MDDVDHTVDEPDLAVRADYEWGTLSAADVGDDPVVEVRRWLAEAQAHIGVDFNAMVLCTVDATGSPSARNVLLRELDDQGRWLAMNDNKPADARSVRKGEAFIRKSFNRYINFDE